MLLVNVNTKQFIPSAGSNFIQPVESRDQIIYGTRVEVRFQLYNPDGTVFVLNESDTFCCGGDNNFVHTDDLMFYSGHEMCRIIDAAQGIVGVTIDATSDSFADKATSQNTRMYVQLKRHVAGDTLGDTVLQDIVYAQPAVMTTEGAPASSDPEYMTAAATLALLRTAPDYQFSVDGETNWHDQQDIAADRFYRERRNGGEWGPAIELIEGKTGPTGAAAGFGTPSVTVETLPAGSDATASVTASGDNTAKVFNFNFGIPKGADGKNGTDGKAGADGADGVSSYTYVAYASDASGTGFSLTPSNALKFRAEIHTTTAIETPDAGDFIGATWVKYIGDDGTGAGDMTKAVYDTDNDGIVDHAATADTVGTTTAEQVADAVGKAHSHANKATLDKFGETDGKPTFDGSEIGGASNWNDITGKPETFPPSAHNHAITDVTGLEDALQNAGSVKSVNGQLPDESGNVTIETGSAVDESRLLPETGSVSSDSVGNPVIFKAISRIDNTYWLCLPLNEDTNDRSTYDVATGVYGTVNIVSNAPSSPGGSAFFNGSSCLHGTLPAQFGTSDFTVRFWMMAPAMSGSSSSHTLFSTRNGDETSENTFGILCTGDGHLFVYSNGDVTSRSDTPFTLQSNVWYHIAVVRKEGVLTIYVNGSVYASGTFTNELTRQIFGIGASWTGSSYSEAGTVYLTSLDVLNYAAYDGAFTTPTYEPGILAGAGYEVATDDEVKNMLSTAGIDESRLLPENPASGDIPCFDTTATVGGGNDANTKVLLHFDELPFFDIAAGNASPAAVTNSGITLDTENFRFGTASARFAGGSNNLKVAVPKAQMRDLPWLADCWFKVDDGQWSEYRRIFTQDDEQTGGWTYYLMSSNRVGVWVRGITPDEPASQQLSATDWHYAALVYFNFKLYAFVDGARFAVVDCTPASFLDYIMLGKRISESGYSLCGNIDEFRLQLLDEVEIGKWTGTSIAVPDAPYSKPQTVGKWGKFNKANIPVLEAEPVDGNLMLYTTQTFNVSDTMHLLHFDDPDQWFKDETGNYTGAATRSYYAFSTNITKFGTGGLQYQDPNGTSEYKTRNFDIANISPLKGPQDAVTLEFWFYIDQSCIFEIPDIMAKKGTAMEHWNFHLVNKMIYPDDIATPVKDVAVLSYHDFDEVSTYTKVETPWSRPTISEGWHHFAFCRDSAYNHYVFLDGAMLLKVLGSQFGSSPYLCPIVPDATTSSIGCDLSFDTQVLCYQDELRYSSVCLYTKNFVPPSEPFTYDAEAANKDVTGWFPASPGVIGLITGINNLIPSASGQLTIPEASKSFPGLMSATDKGKLDSFNITEYKDRPGYFKLPGGIIVQWGAVLDVSESKTFDVTLPVAFPHLGWVSLASGTSTTVATAAYFNGANALKVVTNVTGAGSFAVYWIAIGY